MKKKLQKLIINEIRYSLKNTFCCVDNLSPNYNIFTSVTVLQRSRQPCNTSTNCTTETSALINLLSTDKLTQNESAHVWGILPESPLQQNIYFFSPKKGRKANTSISNA